MLTLEFRPTEQYGLSVSDIITNFDAVCISGELCRQDALLSILANDSK
jgi:hypothetical protein